MSCVIMNAKTAKFKADKNISKVNDRLIEDYTQLINDRILESIKKGKSYYGNCSIGYSSEHKFSEISDIVEAEFEKEGYRFRKCTYAGYFRWDDEEL
jgi:hypothetical protein